MKLVSLALAASLAATPALACLPIVSTDGLSISISRGISLVARFNYADLRTSSRAKQAVELMDAMQALMDDVRTIESIESIDPDKNFDPNRATLFWIDEKGERTSSILQVTHVVSRCALITDVFWDGFDFITSWRVVR